MFMPFTTNFKPWSLGRVVENKVRGSKIIKVHPFEVLPHMPEEMTADVRTRKKQGLDHTGAVYSATVTEQAWIEAKWKGNTFFRNAPDVAKGELVMLYRLGNSDVIYWEVFGRDDFNRKQEDFHITVSAKKDYDPGTPQPHTKDNSYQFRINTYDKFINISTSNNNGEYTTFEMTMDGGNGQYTLVDGEQNRIHLDTKKTLIELYNRDDSLVRLEKEDITIKSNKTVNIETETFNITCTNLNIKTKTFAIDSESYTHNSKSVEINSNTYSCTASNIALNGNIGLNGPVSVGGAPGGARSGGSKASFKGPVEFEGPVDLNAAVSFKAEVSFGIPLKVTDHSLVHGT